MTGTTKKSLFPTSPQKTGKVGYKSPPVSVETQFKPGNRANPGGKPVKSKNRLQGDFMWALAQSFSEHGPSVIQRVINERPHEYLKIIASLMPRAMEVSTSTLDNMSLEKLEEALATLQAMTGQASH